MVTRGGVLRALRYVRGARTSTSWSASSQCATVVAMIDRAASSVFSMFRPLTSARRVFGQELFDGFLRRRLVLGLFPEFDERGVRRQRGDLS
jgi:hypothetical protein